MADTLPTLGEIPDAYFTGASRITSGQLPQILNALANTTRTMHVQTVTPSLGTQSPGQAPTPIIIGNTLGLQFSIGDEAYRLFKIPTYYAGNAAFHVHWTKSANPSEQGNSVRWKLEYTVWQGNGGRIDDGTSYVLDVDDTYDDGSADNARYTHRTHNEPAAGFTAGYYVGLKITCDFANTTLLAAPILLSADMTYEEYINK